MSQPEERQTTEQSCSCWTPSHNPFSPSWNEIPWGEQTIPATVYEARFGMLPWPVSWEYFILGTNKDTWMTYPNALGENCGSCNCEKRKCYPNDAGRDNDRLTLCGKDNKCITFNMNEKDHSPKVGQCYTLNDTVAGYDLKKFLKDGDSCSLVGVPELPEGYQMELYALYGHWPVSQNACHAGGKDHYTLKAPNCRNADGTASRHCDDLYGFREGKSNDRNKYCAFKIVKK